MKTVYPNYYKRFKCIAERCRHSCCVGWEIDIDEDTLCYYEAITGKLGDRIRSAICYDGQPHFALLENERCPFLNKSGLCDIITSEGEDALCDICADHPRFRNYFDNAVEIGLGLCCEAAADIILNDSQPFELENFDINDLVYTKRERKMLAERAALIEIMQNRSISAKERQYLILQRANISLPKKSIAEWCDFYFNLERLDDKWGEMLCALKTSNQKEFCNHQNDTVLEQLIIYFLYRHCQKGVKKAAGFAVLSVKIIATLSSVLALDLTECARMYSAEIEYSDENTQKIFKLFK